MNYGKMQINLEKILEEKHLSKNRLSQDLNIDRTVVTNYCKGRMKRLDISILTKICYYLKVDFGDLVTYISPDEESNQ